MKQEENTENARQIAKAFGISFGNQDKLCLTFSRKVGGVVCKIECQVPNGRYISLQVSVDETTGEKQIENLTSDRALPFSILNLASRADQELGLPCQAVARKGIFIFPQDTPARQLIYQWDQSKNGFKLDGNSELEQRSALYLSGLADKMIAATKSLEA